MPYNSALYYMMGPSSIPSRVLSRLITHEYALGTYAVGALVATALFAESTADWTFFDMEFEEFALAALLLLLYFLFTCTLWIRAWYLKLPDRDPQYRNMSLSGGVVASGYGLVLLETTSLGLELAWMGLGVALVGIVVLSREVACWFTRLKISP